MVRMSSKLKRCHIRYPQKVVASFTKMVTTYKTITKETMDSSNAPTPDKETFVWSFLISGNFMQPILVHSAAQYIARSLREGEPCAGTVDYHLFGGPGRRYRKTIVFRKAGRAESG